MQDHHIEFVNLSNSKAQFRRSKTCETKGNYEAYCDRGLTRTIELILNDVRPPSPYSDK
jgi:hypothetical protein